MNIDRFSRIDLRTRTPNQIGRLVPPFASNRDGIELTRHDGPICGRKIRFENLTMPGRRRKKTSARPAT